MIDLRIWRAALLAVPVALIVAMFSLQDAPRPLEPPLPPDAFDVDAARSLTRELARSAPAPRPGSDQDAALAERVESLFTQIPGAQVSEQSFTGSFGGDDVELRNLIAVLPGESESQIALIANRDSAEGSGAATSIASTAALLEIASGFSGSTHTKTLVFVSTDGGDIGALGAKQFVRNYSDAGQLDAAVVLSQPAAPEPTPPLEIPWSNGPESTGAALARTAGRTLSEEVGVPPGDEGPLDDLFRLAIPASFGEQAPLIEAGVDSVRLSSSGELPPPPERDGEDDVKSETLDGFGRSALSLLLALDAAPSPLERGPGAYIGVAGNLLPGWTLSMLALVLLATVAIVASVGIAAAASSPLQAAGAIGWSALRALPFLIGLAGIFACSLLGLIPGPEFPFDPASQSPGLVGSACVLAALAATGVAAFLLRPLLPPSPAMAATAPAAALLLATVAAFGVWLINPYLGLLVAIGLQAWVPAAGGAGGGGAEAEDGRLAAAGLVALGTVPVLAGLVDLAGRFDSGFGVFWDLLLLFSG
ncbi:MAG: M28 family peptidase, partial [Actinomycetota bacterium]|nr:M28 family peptidase [Actinomycetota bacterium]